MSHSIAQKKSEFKKAAAAAKLVQPNANSDLTVPVDNQLIQRKPACACGGSCPRCQVETHSIQPKLTISQPNDHYEREADRVADQVMRMPEPTAQRHVKSGHDEKSKPEEEEGLEQAGEDETIPVFTKPISAESLQRQPHPKPLKIEPVANTITPLVQRQSAPEVEEEELAQPGYEEEINKVESEDIAGIDEMGEEGDEESIQAKGNTETVSQVTPRVTNDIQSIKGTGQPLPASERTFFEPRFGKDFSHVRVHIDNHAARTAQSINARAFTFGNNMVFGSGQFSPGTQSGRSLLAHELTHVVQQQKPVNDLHIQKFESCLPWRKRKKKKRVPLSVGMARNQCKGSLDNAVLKWVLKNFVSNMLLNNYTKYVYKARLSKNSYALIDIYYKSFGIEKYDTVLVKINPPRSRFGLEVDARSFFWRRFVPVQQDRWFGTLISFTRKCFIINAATPKRLRPKPPRPGPSRPSPPGTTKYA